MSLLLKETSTGRGGKGRIKEGISGEEKEKGWSKDKVEEEHRLQKKKKKGG